MAYLEQLAGRGRASASPPSTSYLTNAPGAPKAPQLPKVPGAPPTPSRPADKVNPPAAASGPVGRPSLPPPSFPGGAGRALPVSGTAGPAATPPRAPSAAPGPVMPPTKGVVPAPAPPVLGAGTAPGGVGTAGPTAPLTQQFDHIPTRAELAGLMPGVQVQTPYGSVDRTGSLTLSPEGEAKYREAMVARGREYGPHPFGGDPNAPKPPVALGRPMINPFTGRWIR